MSKISFKDLNKVFKIIKPLGSRGYLNWMSDESYLKLVFRGELGEKLDLEFPKTYNEKLQWLKLNDQNPAYTTYVDKFEVRNYIRKKLGDEYLIPLIDVFEKPEDIKWERLPNKFVLKCTHGSSSNIICNDKNKLNINAAEKKLKKWMNKSWYWYGREWPYKNQKPKIICEYFLQDNIVDYKFMCFSGEPKLIQIHSNRNNGEPSLDFYDIQWNKTDIRRNKKTSNKEIPKPKNLEKMLQIARELSKEEIHVRIDLYEVEGKIFFGEKTYYSASGFSPFYKSEHDELIGSWINIDKN